MAQFSTNETTHTFHCHETGQKKRYVAPVVCQGCALFSFGCDEVITQFWCVCMGSAPCDVDAVSLFRCKNKLQKRRIWPTFGWCQRRR